MGGTQIFLHECVSPNGSQVLVALYMRPNVDHMQFCSIDATVVVPASFSRPPIENRHVVDWVRGWSDAVKWDKLKWAQLEPADHSHIIFTYDSPPPKWSMDGGDYMDDPAAAAKPVTLYFWLQDDGQIVDHPPAVSPKQALPVRVAPKPPATRDFVQGPPRPAIR
jgi:hypothetical protein